MTRVLVIVNPVAARTHRLDRGTMARDLARLGWRVDLVETAGPGDARGLAAAAVADGAGAVLVHGGDGTTMQAAAALVGTGVPIGLIPGGTGNLLAGNVRMPARWRDVVEVFRRATTRTIDLGAVEREDGLHYFAVAAGAGLDATVMAKTGARAKRRFGMAAYVATTLRHVGDLVPRAVTLTLDGVTSDHEATLVLVANSGEVFPPYLRLGPAIAMDDGWLDVILVRARGIPDGLRVIWRVLRGHPGAPPPGLLAYHRARTVTVQCPVAQPVQLDGDSHGTTPFTATILPGALRVFVPTP